MNKLTTQTCAQCGSPLTLIDQVTEKLDGSRFPQTTSSYLCTNKSCQDERDKETDKRIKLRKEKELADQKRAENKLHARKIITLLSSEKKEKFT